MNTCGINAVRVISRSQSSGDPSDKWKNVLDYWFSPAADKKWFHGGPQVDEEIRQKFGSLVSEIILYSVIKNLQGKYLNRIHNSLQVSKFSELREKLCKKASRS